MTSKFRTASWLLAVVAIGVAIIWWALRSPIFVSEDVSAPAKSNLQGSDPSREPSDRRATPDGSSPKSAGADRRAATPTFSRLERRRSSPIRLNPYGLDGLVIDPQRKAIAGARIEIQSLSSETGVSGPSEERVSGPDGSFYVRRSDPGKLRLRCEAQGYARRELEVELPLPGLLQTIVVLQPADSEVEGRVIDIFSGRPIRGAVVQATYEARFEGATNRESLRAETDLQGYFHFGPVPGGSIQLTAARAGFFEDIKHLGLGRGQRLETVLRLVPADTREFQLTDPEGVPVAGGTVVRPDGWRIEADEQGRFRLPLIPELRSLHMEISAPGYLSHRIDAPAAEVPETIVLTPGPRLEGRVRDRRGRAVEGAEVAVLMGEADQRPAGLERTDADGRFSVALSGTEIHSVRVRKAGYVDQNVEFPSRELPREPLEFDLRKSDVALQLQILRAGLPARRAFVRLRQLEGPNRGTVWFDAAEDATGRVLLSDLSAGVYEVEAKSTEFEGTNFRIWHGSAQVELPSNRMASLTLHLSPAQELILDIREIMADGQELSPITLPSR